jgi:hypothetical protein
MRGTANPLKFRVRFPHMPQMTIDLICIEGAGNPLGAKALEYSYENFNKARQRILVSTILPDFFKGEFHKIPRISYEDYNRFCIWGVRPITDADFVLIIQSDGMIINPNFWTDDFLNYDYVGAPWNDNTKSRLDGINAVGNGGFSLRSRKFLELSSKIEPALYDKCKKEQQYGGNEDLFLCKYMYSHFIENGVKFAPPEVAAKFSFEEPVYGASLKTSFGFHGKAASVYQEMIEKLNSIYR